MTTHMVAARCPICEQDDFFGARLRNSPDRADCKACEGTGIVYEVFEDE